MNIILFANGPGELYERAYPFARILRKEFKDIFIVLVLTPCQFSSGEEYRLANNSHLFDRVIKLKNPFHIPSLLADLSKKKFDVIFHMGGDILYVLLFSLLLNTKVYSYGGFFRYKYFIDTYFVPYDGLIKKAMKKGISLPQIAFLGSFSFLEKFKNKEKKRKEFYSIGIFPGSRKVQFEHLFPFFLKVVETLSSFGYNLHLKLYLSPFISLDFLKQVLLMGPKYKVLDFSLGDIKKEDKNNFYVLSSGGVKVKIEFTHENLLDLDFAITTPGTSTLTLSNFGVPMFIIAPFNKVEIIPLNGIINFVGYIPFIGLKIKKRIVLRYLKKKDFLGLPNIIENKEIVPEIKGNLNSYKVALRIQRFLSKKEDFYKIKIKLVEFRKKYTLRVFKIEEFLNKTYE